MRRAGNDAATRRTLEDVAASASDMARLVDALLWLRRAGEGAADETFDAAALVRGVAGRAACDAGRPWNLDVPARLTCTTQRTLLTSAAENLLSNAAAHACGAGEVRVALFGDAAALVLEVSNPTANLPPTFAARACEPFWRADAARGDGDHFGLGLTLVDECCRRVGGDVSFVVAGNRLTARLRWPAIVTVASSTDA